MSGCAAPMPLAPARPRIVGPRLHAALRAGARGPGDAGILVLAELDARRDRGDAGRLHRRRRRHGRDRCRHLRRHPLRPHGASAACRRSSPTAWCATWPACCGTGLPVWCRGTAAPPSVAGLTFVGWQQPIGCGGVAVFPDDVVVVDDDGAVLHPAGARRRRRRGGGAEQERLEELDHGRGRARRAAARPLSAERREQGALRGVEGGRGGGEGENAAKQACLRTEEERCAANFSP